MKATNLPITGPCPIDLDAIGFDRDSKVSHCTHCVKNVHNLSNMSRGEARSFLRDNKGKRMCVSYARKADGQIRFRGDAPAVAPVQPAPALVSPALVSIDRLRRPPRRAAPMAAAAALGATLAMAACTPHGDHQEVGKMTVVETPPVPPVVETPPEPIPVAGGMVVPEQIMDGEVAIPEEIVRGEAVPVEMLEGDIEVPDPDTLDEPCSGKAKAEPKAEPKVDPAPHASPTAIGHG